MTINENASLESLLSATVADANIYFDDWDRGHREGDEFVKTTAHGQIDAVLRIIRRIDSAIYADLKEERDARLKAAYAAESDTAVEE